MKIDYNNYPSINVLIFLLSKREAYRPTLFSKKEIFCGPDCETASENNLYRTIKTPVGTFDISVVLDKLSDEQKPDLVIIKADATRRIFPANLNKVKCQKLLILGNTQHLTQPIRLMLTYAKKEKLDFIISDHKRHHLHYFKEAGFKGVYWIPGLNIFPRKQPWQDAWQYPVSFVGQVGEWHPYRQYIMSQLQAAGLRVDIFQVPHEQAAQIYAKSLINLNCSLNGDLNLRIFEVLSSGGFLLADRLSKESGMDIIFREGKHFVSYTDENDLKKKIDYYTQNPEKAKDIAKKGCEEFWKNHNPEKKVAELMDFIFNNSQNPAYKIDLDKRSSVVCSSLSEELSNRVSIYEYIQEIHLNSPAPEILLWPSIDARVICDIKDLPRLRININGMSQDVSSKTRKLLEDTDTIQFIQFKPGDKIREEKQLWDAITLTANEFLKNGIKNIIEKYLFKSMIILPNNGSFRAALNSNIEKQLGEIGLVKSEEMPLVFKWVDMVRLGEMFIEQKKYSEAFTCFKSMLNEEPINPKVLYNLGIISLNVNDSINAEAFFRDTLELDHANINALMRLSDINIEKNRPDEALPFLQRAIAFEKNSVDLWNKIALCYEQTDNIKSSIEAYEKSLDLEKNQPFVRNKINELLNKDFKNASIKKYPPIKKKRIMVVNNLYPPQELGGYGRLSYDFSNILNSRGHTIHVLTSDTPYLGDVLDKEEGIVRTLELYGEWKNGVTRKFDDELAIGIIKKNLGILDDEINKFSPDFCLFGNVDFIGYQLIESFINKRIPVIHHLGGKSPGYNNKHAPRNKIYRLATASKWLRETIWQNGYPLEKIDVIYPGAIVRYFYTKEAPKLDKLRIAYAGIVLPYKGAHVLIKALMHLKQASIDFSATFTGTTTNESFVNQLKKICQESGLDSSVTFTGFLKREELKKMFSRHNIMVFPSIVPEAFGISQVEAMAAGLIVVSSGTGGAAEIIEHDKSGVIFQSENYISLANELIKLANDPKRWENIRLNGQQRAMEEFDIERSVDKIEEIFSELSFCV